VVVILDVSGMDDQRPMASFQNALRVGSSDVSREFRQSEVPACIGSSNGRKFWHALGVPMVGSSGMHWEFRHLTNFNSVN